MIKLYHGSNVEIEQIDLSKSRPFKDFGRAFYLSVDVLKISLSGHIIGSKRIRKKRGTY